MRVPSLIVALFAFAVAAEDLVIPEVEEAIRIQLKLFHNWTHYDGPKGSPSHDPNHSEHVPNVKRHVHHPHGRHGEFAGAEMEKRAATYWYESIAHQGVAAFNSDSTYKVYRNVKSYGAKGDGVTDDTKAIQSAISAGNRCAPGSCKSSTNKPAVVYFPAGTYLISSSIIDYYQTQLIGNPNSLPVIKATPGLTGLGLIDGDQYGSGGLGFGSTNIFWRQIRNFVIDMTAIPASSAATGIHWPTAQATSIQNVVFKMSSNAGTKHQGLFIEEGSGGFMTDLKFYGGLYGCVLGNQQFTMRNFAFYNVQTAISQLWNWGFAYSGLSVNNCTVGLDITNGGSISQQVGSVTVFDSSFTDTTVAFNISHSSDSAPPTGGSVVIENVSINNVAVAIRHGDNRETYLAGTPGSATIAGWGAGHQYSPNGPTNVQGPITPFVRPASLLSGGRYYTRSKPQYETLPSTSFSSVRSGGAKGDGVTDDTAKLQAVINAAASAGKIVYFDAGTYKVTKTLFVPKGSKIVGEGYAVIMSSGSFWGSSSSAKPVVQVGNAGDSGVVEWSDMIVSTQGSQPGAILIEWNLASACSAPSGMWDVHTRIGGFVGSSLQKAQCPTSTPYTNSKCYGAYMSMHVGKSASALYLENVWLWTADHDVDDADLTQINVYTGRGLYVESTAGTLWLWGTAVEHHQRYQYQFANTKSVFMGFIQTETPYYQPNPKASLPFSKNLAINDPDFDYYCPSGSPANCAMAFGLRIVASSNILTYGAGLYSFFNDYSTSCSAVSSTNKCQQSIFTYDSAKTTGLGVYNLNTVGSTSMVDRDKTSLANYAPNVNKFPSTIFRFVNA